MDHQWMSKGQTTNNVSLFITSERQLIMVEFALQLDTLTAREFSVM